jgi:hypothetical protein
MTPQQFWDACEAHDWWYEMSDDHSVWKRGRAARDQLHKDAQRSEVHKAIYQGFIDYNNALVKDDKSVRKPERPNG